MFFPLFCHVIRLTYGRRSELVLSSSVIGAIVIRPITRILSYALSSSMNASSSSGVTPDFELSPETFTCTKQLIVLMHVFEFLLQYSFYLTNVSNQYYR